MKIAKANKRQVLQPIDQNTVFPESKIGQSESGNTTITLNEDINRQDESLHMETTNSACKYFTDMTNQSGVENENVVRKSIKISTRDTNYRYLLDSNKCFLGCW
ncbi:uncharacterized protein LOC123873549 [Maniola jurtina]|uniref:uncharacterized protein LOC123873549 n=1 Tax=Maniola jurtina TaxID=191418 RepID=UPI001E689B33|nr:uncharacterized protein LOC123873549 [Maniola jurtina]